MPISNLLQSNANDNMIVISDIYLLQDSQKRSVTLVTTEILSFR